MKNEETLKLQRSHFRSLYKDLKGKEHNNKIHMSDIQNIHLYKKVFFICVYI